MPRAVILSVGSEILLGETVDTNATFLGGELARAGVELATIRALHDDRSVIAGAIGAALIEADVVLATGGLGPTHDDLTRDGAADALGEEQVEDPELRSQLLERFGGAGRMPASNLRQAMRIPSAAILANPIGSAPGWWVEREGRLLVLMPGVPSEMRRMWTEEVAPRLAARWRLTPLAVRTVKTFGIGESAVADRVGDLLTSPGEGITAGIYARDDGVHLRFARHGDPDGLDGAVERALAALGEDAYGTDAQTLPGLALAALARAGVQTLETVESGTDGALLAILAAHGAIEGEARFAGGCLQTAERTPPAIPPRGALLAVHLGSAGALGRSRVRVALVTAAGGSGGGAPFAEREIRIHGSGPQRARRGAYAALDQVRRIRPGSTSDR